MDYFFSLKGKEAFLVSGIMGVVIYFSLLGGDADENKYYYFLLGYPVWIIFKLIYWKWRTSNIIRLYETDINRFIKELEEIKQLDEERAYYIESKIFYN